MFIDPHHSNSQPLIQLHTETHSRNALNYCKSDINFKKSYEDTVISFTSKEKVEEFVKSQLGLNYILIDLNVSKSEQDILSQAKYELIREIRLHKKLMFMLGIDEKQLSNKIEEVYRRKIQQYIETIKNLEQEIETIKSERDTLKEHFSYQLEQTFRLSSNLLNHSHLDSQLSQTLLNVAMSPAASTLSLNNETITSLQTFADSPADLDRKIPSTLQVIRDYIQSKDVTDFPMTQEQKEIQIVKKNREALLKKYMMIESKQVDVDESIEELMPHSKPPNTCTVILETQDNSKFRNLFPKLQFDMVKNILQGNNLPLSSTRKMTQNEEICDAEQSEFSMTQRSISLLSQNSGELSQLAEEVPLQEFAIDFKKVKHNH